jgi:hypothetical protein
MTLSLLKLLGHSIAVSLWSDHSKCVIWTASCVAFFGSFRFGELLASSSSFFNVYETLLWSDIRFIDENSIQIHVKLSKTRKPGGEYVSLFTFPNHNCCPILALQSLRSFQKNNLTLPVFTFANNKFLTKSLMNKYIVQFLKPHIGEQANFYSCKSFRAALPSALAAFPHIHNDKTIRRWGRWDSKAFERYTRLDHKAKKAIFSKFVKALDKCM